MIKQVNFLPRKDDKAPLNKTILIKNFKRKNVKSGTKKNVMSSRDKLSSKRDETISYPQDMDASQANINLINQNMRDRSTDDALYARESETKQVVLQNQAQAPLKAPHSPMNQNKKSFDFEIGQRLKGSKKTLEFWNLACGEVTDRLGIVGSTDCSLSDIYWAAGMIAS